MSHRDQDPTRGLHGLLVLLCVSVPAFMINLDSNIVAVSLPSIGRALKADFSDIEWVVGAYTLAFASVLMPAGALADSYGRRRALLIGLVIFSVSSFACGVAPTIVWLNVARTLEGFGAAMQLSASLAVLSHEFRGPARTRAFAFWGSVIGVAVAAGPIIGGVVTQSLGWRWAFEVNVPIGAAMIALTSCVLEESRDPDATRIDVPGVLSFAAFLFLTTLALISGNRVGWGSGRVLLEFAAAGALLVVFLVAEWVQKRPMLDLAFLQRPTFVGANIGSIAYAAALLTMLTYLPVYFQGGLHFGPLDAGLLMLPMTIPFFLVPRVAATYLNERLSGRVLLTVSLALAGTGLLWMALEASRFEYSAMFGGMLLAGIGAGLLNSESAKVAMTVIPPERAGMASGSVATLRFAGIVIGFAALGSILFDRISARVAMGLPAEPASDQLALVRHIAAGNLPGMSSADPQTALHALALGSFGSGYEAILIAAAALAGLAALLSWILVRVADTAPTSHSTMG